MNKITTFLVIIIIALSFMLGTTSQSKAQQKSFIGILPFVTTSNRVGFFDQNTGRIYMYDDNISQCIYIGQMNQLGQPVNVVSAGPNTTSIPSNL